MVYFLGKLCNKSLSHRDVPAENVFSLPFLLTNGKTNHYFLSPSNPISHQILQDFLASSFTSVHSSPPIDLV